VLHKRCVYRGLLLTVSLAAAAPAIAQPAARAVVSPTSEQAQTSSASANGSQGGEESSANRKGFIIGFGAGAGLHRPPSFVVRDRFGRVVSSGGGEDKLAIATDFSVGYASSDRLLLYYSNKIGFTTDDRVDGVSVTGFGVTYMFRRSSPSAFVSGSGGLGAAATFITSRSAETGPGFTAGGGYEFARHLSINGDAIFVRLESGQQHRVLKASFNFLFY